MELLKALTLSLGEIEDPVITRYRLGVILHHLYRDKTYKGERLRIQKEGATSQDFNKRLAELLRGGLLKSSSGYGSGNYQLLGRKPENMEEVACCIDPFCYVSHLSAMSHHGLSLRMPVKIFITSPTSRKWSDLAGKRMEKDLGTDLEFYFENGLPPLTRSKIETLGRIDVHRFSSIHWGSYVNIRGKNLRVSSIGKTFLDMLKNPELCGGMNHVIETFQDHALNYLPLIVEEINLHGGPIDKVRCGYILDEILQISLPVLDQWVEFAQRGGSRKLDPTGEYLPEWSEKWCLSLNL